jgi:acetyltransferase-like isoleucine patch superfamily enzyme
MLSQALKGVEIHPTAEIEEGAAIGEGTRIWHYAHVRRGARIGKNCSLGRNVYVDTNVVIGDNVKIQNNVSVYEGVCLHDDAFVGPSAVFTNDPYPRSFPNGWQKTPTVVERGASIGANATILCGLTIGAYAMIAAGAVVCRDVPAYALVVGPHGEVAGKVDRSGRRVAP